jgi:hypothetical protein
MSDKVSVTIFFPDGKPFISYDNSTHQIEIVEDVVAVKAGKVIEEFHGFPFVIRAVMNDG